MNELSLNNNEKIGTIKNKIYKVRGVEVMLDSENCCNQMTRNKILDLLNFKSIYKINIILSILN